MFGFGAGSDPTFVDDDGGPDLTDSAAHPGGRYQATAGISSPLVNYASTWGNDREIAYPDDNVLGQLASWTFSNLAPGVYQVSAVWQGHSNRATDATYRIYDGEEIVRVEHRSHQQHSSWTGDGIPVRFATHSSVSGVSVGFKDIGSLVRVTSGTLRVELPNALVGQVVADAIRLERIDVIDPLTSGGVFIRGQGGDDFISAAADLAFAITAFGGYGEDTLIGGAQGDVLSGGMGADVLFGGVGDDHLYGAYPRVYTVVDPDPMNYEEILYQEIVRDDGADTLYGDEGEDRLYVDYANASGDPTVAGRRYTPVGGDIFDLLSGDTIVPQQSLKLDGSGLEAIAAELPVASTWNQGLLWDGDYGFGEGWNLPGIDRLEFTGDAENPTSLTWVRSDGHAVSLEENGGQWTSESGDPSRRTIEIQSTGSVWFDVSDKYGSVAKYVVASSGLALLSEVLDRNGNGYGYVYDSSDATKISEMRIVRNGEEDEVITFGYAPVTVGAGTEDRVTTITDPFGRIVDLSYHNDGRLHSIELPQIAAAIGYNVIGLVSLRPTTSFTYDGDYISEIDEPDHYTETGFGNLNIVRNYSWNDGELWVEDADPNPVRHVGAPTDVYMRWADLTGGWRSALPAFMLTDGLAPLSSEATQIGYTIDELGRTTVREYNRDGSLVRLELSTGAVVESDVNGAGLPTLVTTQAPGDGRIVDEMALAYDTSFNLVTVSHFDGSEESWTYGVNAQRTSETDEVGRTTFYTLDTWGNIVTTRVVVGEDDRVVTTESDDMVTSYEYSPDGLVIQSVEFRTDVNGTPQTSLVTQYEYTTVADTYSGGVLESHTGRWLAVTRYGGDDPLVSGISAPLTNESSIEVIQRDVYGNAVEVSDELGRTTTYAYDALDRLRQVISPDPGNGQSRERTDITYTTRGALAYRVSGGEGDVVALNGEWGNLNSPGYNDVPGSSEALAALLIYPSGTATKARGDVYNYSICDCDCPTIESLNCLNFPFNEELTSKTMTSRKPDGSTSSVTGPEGQEQAYDYGSTSGMLVRLTTSAASGSEALASFSGEAGAWGEGASDKGDIILQYNARGERIAMRDGSGRIVRYEYDARGRLIATIHSNGDRATLAYNAAGDLIESTDALDRSTRFEFDDAGRLSSMTEPGQALATTYQYDSAGQLRVMTDQLGRETETIYDERGRVVEEIDPNNQSVVYTYYDDNQLESLTDPEQNTTTWTYDLAGRLASETNELTHSESYRYDGFGNLVKLTDRNGRIVAYTYDTLHNLDLERWYSNETDFENNVYSYEIDYDFDHSSRLTRVRDDATGFDYQYVYDGLDRLQSIEMVLAGLSETVNIDRDLDGAGRVTSRSVNLGGFLNSGGSNDDEFVEGAAEFINAYAYDSSGRLATLTQGEQDVSGAREVAEKRVDFNWNAAGQLYTVSRFGDIDAAPASAAAHSVLTYDVVGRIAGIQHRQGTGVAGSMIAGYQYGYDQSHRLTALDFLPSAYDDEDVSFTYDTRGQLTGADYAGSGLLDEAYDYDDNGNREGSQTTGLGSSTYAAAGTNNRLTDDGVYIYDYDNAGNRQFRTSKADGSATRYYWDHRDRLVKVAEFTTLLQAIAGASPTKVVEHRYDAFNQWIGATVDADGVGGGTAAQTVYVYDDGQIILQFDGAASGPLDGGDLSHRYLWGPMVDQILADEQVDWSNTYADGDVLWALTDHLGTVRDIVDDAGTLDSHRVYDSFGNVVDETVGAKDFLFGYTGKAFDEETGLQNNLNRWYDAKVGRWMSEDPIGFAANSANLVGYVDNTPTLAIDPSGLIEVFPRRLPPPPDDPVLLPDPDVPLSDPKNPMSDGPLYNPTIGPLSDYCLPTPTDHDPFSLKLWDRGWIPGGRIRLNPDLGNPGIIIYGGPNLPGSPVRGSMSPDGTWTPLHPGCDVDDRPGSVQEAERNVNELIREGDLPWLQEHLQRLEEMRRRLRR